MRNVLLTGLLPAVFLLCGCGGPAGPELVPVQGTVTLDGQPLDRATVTFNPPEGRSSSGITDAQGHYVLQYTAAKKGAMPGKCTVIITSEVGASGGEGSPLIPGRKEILPTRYRENSELVAEVTSEQKNYDFALESKETRPTGAKGPVNIP